MPSRGAHLSANSTVTAHGAVPVTPSATEIPVTRALYSGAGGDISVVMADGQAVTFVAVPASVIVPIQVSQVTAGPANVLALY
jgi:hypothetical protein